MAIDGGRGRRLVQAGLGLAARVGVDVRRYRPHPYRPRTLPLPPRTVLDVGAADGTAELYRAYPDALVVAVEPIVEQLDALRGVLAGLPAEFHAVAVGAEEGEAELDVDPSNLLKSSFSRRTALTASNVELAPRRVPVRTLDALLSEHAWGPPFILKIDTEGHDLDVLRGAEKVLANTVALYCETSLAPRFESGYLFRDIATFLLDRGFDLTDVLATARGPDGRTAVADCLWTPVDRPLP